MKYTRIILTLLSFFWVLSAVAQVRDIPVKKAVRTMEQNAAIIDVRTPEEFKAGHLPGAINFNIKDTLVFLQQVNDLDTEKRYLVYCRTGKRSAVAARLMAENGFTRLFNMKGGYVAWLKKDE